MQKWRILILAAPAAIAVLALRFALHVSAGKSGILAFSDTAAVLTGTALIMGLMLSGVIADYKEAERLPSDRGRHSPRSPRRKRQQLNIANVDSSWVHGRLVIVGYAINEWFYSRKSNEELWSVYRENMTYIADQVANSGTKSQYITQTNNANNNLRNSLERIAVIRDTKYLPAGYTLLQLLVAVTFGLLILADFPPGLPAYFVPGAVSLVYMYMLLLIKDLDNPFDYKGDGSQSAVRRPSVPLDRCL